MSLERLRFFANVEGGTVFMRFYTIKLPKFLGGLVRAMLGTFKKE